MTTTSAGVDIHGQPSNTKETVQITNSSDHILQGSMALVWRDLPANVKLVNAGGIWEKNPYLTVLKDRGDLRPRARLRATLELVFIDPPPHDPHSIHFEGEALLAL